MKAVLLLLVLAGALTGHLEPELPPVEVRLVNRKPTR